MQLIAVAEVFREPQDLCSLDKSCERIYQNSEHSLVKQKLPPSEDNTFVHIYEKSTRIKELGIPSVKAIPTL